VKTILYGAITLSLGLLERVLEAIHRAHSLDRAVRYVIHQAGLYRLLAWALGISLVFAIYFVLDEIGQYMGRGKLRALFLESPEMPPTGTVNRRSL